MPLLASQLFSRLNPSQSIKARLIWNTTGMVLVLSLLLSFLAGYLSSRRMETNRVLFLTELASQMADKLEQGMFERYKDIQILSALEAIEQPNSSRSAKRSLLEKLQNLYPNYAWIGLTDTQGNIVSATQGLLEGKNVSQRPWFQLARTKAYVGDVHEALLLAKLLPNSSKEPLRFVDVSAPLIDSQGKFQGVLGAHLSWEWARDVRQSFSKSTDEENSLEIFILSKNGHVLLAPPGFKAKKLAIPNLQTTKPNFGYSLDPIRAKEYLNGFAYTQGYKNYPGLGWIVLIRQNKEIALTAARRLQRQVFFSGLFLGCLFAAIS